MKKALSLIVAVFYLFSYSIPSYAGPQLLGVDSGSVTSETQGNVTNATASDRSISNWDFDIAQAETFNLAQPSNQSVALFRDFTGDASQIFGNLNANGQLFLINTSGVLFGQTAQVNVGGLVASTLDISNQDFLSGNYIFEAAPGAAPGFIDNQGTITAHEGGFVSFLGGAVNNSGTITAQQGSVALAAGNQMAMMIDGAGKVGIQVGDNVTEAPHVYDINGNPIYKSAVANSGTITADGGKVSLMAKAVEAAYDSAINQSGLVQAQSVGVQNGEVILGGGDEGIVSLSGIIDVTGQTGEKGGTAQVLGDKIGVFSGAKIDASGDLGGGTILVGGDFRGQNSAVQNSSRTYVAQGATLDASAGASGNGGKVIVWSNDATVFDGLVLAKGGSLSGNGGFAEVSSKGYYDFNGSADLSASNGAMGTLLLDPIDILISDADDTDGASGGDILYADAPGVEPWHVSSVSLEALAADIILEADNNVTLAAGTNLDLVGAGVDLTIRAGDDILLNGNLSTTDGSITLVANDAGGSEANTGTAGVITMAAATTITAGGAGNDVSLSAQGDITITSITALDDISITSTGGSIIEEGAGDAAVDLSATDLILTAGGAIGGAGELDIETTAATLNASTTAAGNIVITETDAIDLIDVDTSDGAITIVAGGAITATDLQSSTDSDTNDITLTAATGDIAVGTISAGAGAGDVILTATAGAITDGNGATNNISADDLLMTASTGIGTAAAGAEIDTTILNLEATTATGGIFLTNSGGFTIGATGGLTGVSITGLGTDIRIFATSPITVDELVENLSGGNITLAALGTGSSDDLTINADINAAGGNGNITLVAGDTISLSTGANVTAAGTGAVRVAAGEDFTDADLTDEDGSDGGDVTMDTGSSIESVDGDINITAPDAIALGEVDADSNADTVDGNVIISSTFGAVSDSSSAETFNVRGDLVTITANGAIGGTVAFDLDTAATTLNVSSTTAGGIFIGELDGVNLLDIDTADGQILITTGGATTITDVDSSNTNNEANDISITASTGTVTVGLINAGAAGDVTVAAGAGAIVDGNVAVNNITADDLTLLATAGIATAGDRLETAVTNLEASGGTGGVFLTNTGALTIGGIGATVGVSATGSDIFIMAASPLTVSEAIANSGGGDITLIADGATAADDLAVNANITATGGLLGDILLVAGDTISFSGTSTTSVIGTGTITLRAGENFDEGTDPPFDRDGNLGVGGGDILMTDGAVIQSEDGDILFDAAADITLGVVNANSDADGVLGAVTMAAVAGQITDGTALDTIANITGSTLTLDAAVGIGGAGDPADLDTLAATLDISTTGAGSIFIAEANGVTITDATTANGAITINTGGATVITNIASTTDNEANDITVATTTGNLNITTINAGATGDVTLSTGLGAIVDDNAAANNITAEDLVLSATTGVGTGADPFETTISRLEAAAGTGGLFIENTGVLTIGNIGVTNGVSVTGSDLSIINSDAFTINELISLGGGGNITLVSEGAAATDDMAVNANINSTGGGNITLVAGDDITLGSVTVSAAVTGDVSVYAGEDFSDGLHVHPVLPNGSATGDILMTSGSTIQSDEGDILLDALQNIELAAVDADGDNDSTLGTITTIAHTGTVSNAPGFGGFAIVADVYFASSVGGFGTNANPLNTNIRFLELEVTGTTGGIYLRNTGTLNIGDATDTLTGIDMTNAANAFDIEIFTTAEFTINERVDHQGTGDIKLASTGSGDSSDLTILNLVAQGTNPPTSIAIAPQAGDIFAASGDIVLVAGDTLTIENSRSVDTNGAGATITLGGGINYATETFIAGSGNSNGNVTMDSTSSVTTNDGNILIDAADTVSLATVNADADANLTFGDVTVNARGGAIIDNNGGGTMNITADALDMRASADIAQSGTGNRLDIDVNSVEAQGGAFGGIGGVFLTNTGALTIGGVTGTLSGIDASDSIEIFATSPITVNEEVSDVLGGNITLAATGLAATDDLTINANIFSVNGNGTILLTAGDDIIIANGVTISTTGTGTATLAAGENYLDEILDADGNSDGDITMGTFGSATGTVKTEDGNIVLDATDSIELAVVNANGELVPDPSVGDVIIYARRGSILDADAGATLNITADALEMRADDGIGTAANRLETNINAIEAAVGDPFVLATGGTGGIFVNNTNPTGTLTIGGVTGLLSGITANHVTDGIEIFTDGALTVASGETVTQTGGGNITLASTGTSATDDITINANVAATGGNANVIIAAGETVTIAGGVTVSANGTGDVVVAAGEDYADFTFDQDGNSGGDIVMQTTATVSSQDGDITLDARDSVTLAVANANSNADGLLGDVFVIARSTNITDNNAATLNITADEIGLSSVTGIATSANRLEVVGVNLAAIGGTGGVFIEQVGSVLNVGSVASSSATGVGFAGIGATATGNNIEIISTGATGALTTSNAISNTGGGNILVSSFGSAAANDVTIGANIGTTGGNGEVNLIAGDTVTISSGATVSAVGTGAVTVRAGEDFADGIVDLDGTTTGDILMGATGTITTANASRVILDAANDVTVGVIDADSNASGVIGDLSIYARRGDVLDSNAATLNINADEVEIKSDDGVGAFGDRIETNINFLEVTVGDPFTVGDSAASGGVYVENQKSLTLGGVSGLSGALTGVALNGIQATGDIEIFATGAGAALTADEVVHTTGTNGTGGIILGSKGSAAGNDLTINQNVTSDLGAGDILLVAGDTVTLASTKVVSTTGAGNINVLAGHDFSVGGEVFGQDGNAGGDVIMGDASSMITPDGNIVVNARDNVQLSLLNANSDSAGVVGDVTVEATAGSITDISAAETPNIIGSIVTLDAAFDIGGAGLADLDTTAASLNVTTTSASAGSDIVISETNGVTLTDIDTVNGSITINAGGAVVVTDVASTTDIDTNDIIIITTTGDIDVATVDAGSASGAGTRLADVILQTSAGAINDTNGATLNIAGDDLTLLSTTGIQTTADRMETQSSNIEATGGTGGVHISNTGALTIGGIGATVGISASGATGISVLNSTAITTSETIASSGGGDILLAAQGGTAADTLTVNANITASGGAGMVTLVSGGSFSQGAASIISATGLGDINVGAGEVFDDGADPAFEFGGDATSDITQADGAVIQTEDGNILLSSPDSIALSLLNADSNNDLPLGSSDITLNAVAGGITDNTFGEGVNIIGDVLTSDSATGFGTGATGTGDIETTLITADIDVTGSGSIFVNETDGLLIPNMTTANGPITVLAAGALTLTNLVSTSDADGNDISIFTTTGDISLFLVNAQGTAADVYIETQGGQIIDSNAGATNVLGEDVSLLGSTGVANGDILEIEALRLDGFGGTGDFNVCDIDSLTNNLFIGVSAATVAGFGGGAVTGVSVTGGNIDVRTFGSLQIDEAVVNSGGGNIILATKGATLGDTVTVNAAVTASGGNGNIIIASGDSMTFTAAGQVSAAGTGQVDIAAGEDYDDNTIDQDGEATADITMDGAASVSSGEGTINMITPDSILLGIVNADGDLDGTRGNVNIDATGGSILDSNAGTLNVTADTLIFTAVGDIGTLADPIEVQVNTLSVFLTGIGTNAYIDQLTGSLTGDIVLQDVFVPVGNFFLFTDGNITANNVNVLGGLTYLDAGGSIFGTSSGSNDIRTQDLTLIAGGVIGTQDNPLTTDITSDSGLIRISAGRQMNELSVHMHGSISRDNVLFLNLPPGLVVYNNHILGGGNIMSLEKSLSIEHIIEEAQLLSFRDLDGRHKPFPSIFDFTNYLRMIDPILGYEEPEEEDNLEAKKA